MDAAQIEQRVERVERAVARLEKLAGLNQEPVGFQAVVGSMGAFPEFDEVMDLVRKRREAEFAAEGNLTVVTRNVSDFVRVPGLRTEDWSK